MRPRTKGPQKHDAQKARLDLIPPRALYRTALTFTHGAIKYSDWNYLEGGGLPASRLLAAALRHINAWQRGIDTDEETTLSHLAHATASLMMLLELLEMHPEQDDRFSATCAENV